MFRGGEGHRPILVTLLSLFYAAAVLWAAVGIVCLATGRPVPLVPFEITLPALAAEMLLFIVLAVGDFRGWRIAWVLTLLANILWMCMDLPSAFNGDVAHALPALIAIASIVVILLKDSRRFFRISRGS